MIRYIYIGNQIDLFGSPSTPQPSRQFAFFDTVSSNFIDFNGEQVFDSVEDFREWCDDPALRRRCEALIPSEEEE